MTAWHVTVRGATQDEINERGLEQAVGEAAVVETDAVKVLRRQEIRAFIEHGVA